MMCNFYSHILCTVVLPEDSQVGQNIKYSKSLEKNKRSSCDCWFISYTLMTLGVLDKSCSCYVIT